ncbi:Mov34/MPN/PAD-1 family protein [Candidatus Poribacteria bacterium]
MKISRQALESVTKHAQQSKPHECCGILMSTSGNDSVVDHIIPAENIEKEDPERGYVLGHKAHLKAVEMEAGGEACIAGYYHSHPNGKARASKRDVEQAINDVIYLITGLGNGEIEHTAWRLVGDDLIPEPLEVSE